YGLDLETNLTLLQKMRAELAGKYRSDSRLNGQIADRFRHERKSLEALLDPANDANNPLAPGFGVFARRSARLAPIVAELKACAQAGRLGLPLTELAPSYVHMHANRLLRSAHRAHAGVLYD